MPVGFNPLIPFLLISVRLTSFPFLLKSSSAIMTMGDSSDRVTFQIVQNDPVKNLNDTPSVCQMLSGSVPSDPVSALEGAPGCVGAVWVGCAIFRIFTDLSTSHQKGSPTPSEVQLHST